MLRLSRENNQLRVVSDQVGCPTFAADVAGSLLTLSRQIAQKRDIRWGTYHLCGRGAVSWYGFAARIFQIARHLNLVSNVQIDPISTPEYPTPAPRPAFSVMACEKIREAFGIILPPWQASLEKMLERISEDAQRQT